jgi:hypothetical protein
MISRPLDPPEESVAGPAPEAVAAVLAHALHLAVLDPDLPPPPPPAGGRGVRRAAGGVVRRRGGAVRGAVRGATRRWWCGAVVIGWCGVLSRGMAVWCNYC